jgi:hypothetical protein
MISARLKPVRSGWPEEESMTKIEDLEKRIQKIKETLKTAEQASPDSLAPERMRRGRKRLKRAQRRLRNLKGIHHAAKVAEAKQKEGTEPAKA